MTAEQRLPLIFSRTRSRSAQAKARKRYPYQIAEFDRALIEADGWVGFADAKY